MLFVYRIEFIDPPIADDYPFTKVQVQDWRRHIWREAVKKRWASLTQLNTWLLKAYQDSWAQLSHSDWPGLTVADVMQDERSRLMALPTAFDGYVEQPLRITSTARSRYDVAVTSWDVACR